MIEYRGMLLVDKKFEGGFKLSKGTIIYARETPEGWLGMYYEDKGSGHGFALGAKDWSIFTRDSENEIILMKEEPEDTAELIRLREIEIEQAHKRVKWRAKAYHEAQAQLEELLRWEEQLR